jgi:hypothetical protein
MAWMPGFKFKPADGSIARDGYQFVEASSEGITVDFTAGPVTQTDAKKFTRSFWWRHDAAPALLEAMLTALANGGSTIPILLFHNGSGQVSIQVTDDDTNTSEVLFDNSTGFDFTDTAKIFYLHVIFDSTQGTPENRLRVFVGEYGVSADPVEIVDAVNGTKTIEANLNVETTIEAEQIGTALATYYSDGTVADVYALDGISLPWSNFVLNTGGGGLKPIAYTGSYGAQGYHLTFGAGTPLNDVSGNGNHFTGTGTRITPFL